MTQMLYAGGGIDSVIGVGGSPGEITTAGHFNSTYAVEALSVSTAGLRCPFIDANGASITVTTGQTLYCHFDVFTNTNFNTGAPTLWQAVNSSFQGGLSLRAVNGTAIGLFGNTGTMASPSWTQLGGSWTPGGLQTYDVWITLGSPHTASVALNGTLLATGTFTQAGLTALAAWEGYGTSNSAWQFSQMMASEGISLIGGFCKHRLATGAGSNSGMTGAYTDINEVPLSDVTVLTAASASLTDTFPMTSVTVPSGSAIKAIFGWIRAKNDGVSPLNVKGACYSGGLLYNTASNLTGMGVTLAQVGYRFDNDPATTVAWTQSGANAAEFGGTSAA